jgi:hypothetical protein
MARDDATWAKPVTKLEAGDVAGAPNAHVGRCHYRRVAGFTKEGVLECASDMASKGSR